MRQKSVIMDSIRCYLCEHIHTGRVKEALREHVQCTQFILSMFLLFFQVSSHPTVAPAHSQTSFSAPPAKVINEQLTQCGRANTGRTV